MASVVAEYQVVVIELFAGLMPATAALQKLGVHSITYYAEVASDPLELAAIHWPNAIPIGDIRLLDQVVLGNIAQKHVGALFWITGGIPCKDVSVLNRFRTGAAGRHTSLYLLAADILKFFATLVPDLAFTFECTRMEDDNRSFPALLEWNQ